METQTFSWDIRADRSRLERKTITVIKGDNSTDKDKQKLKEITTTNYKLWTVVYNTGFHHLKVTIFQGNNVYTVSKKKRERQKNL